MRRCRGRRRRPVCRACRAGSLRRGGWRRLPRPERRLESRRLRWTKGLIGRLAPDGHTMAYDEENARPEPSEQEPSNRLTRNTSLLFDVALGLFRRHTHTLIPPDHHEADSARTSRADAHRCSSRLACIPSAPRKNYLTQMGTHPELGHPSSSGAGLPTTSMSGRSTGPRRAPCGRGAECQSSRIARSSRLRRSGSARTSISTIFSRLTVKPMTANGRPRGVTTTPAAPFTSAGREKGASRE